MNGRATGFVSDESVRATLCIQRSSGTLIEDRPGVILSLVAPMRPSIVAVVALLAACGSEPIEDLVAGPRLDPGSVYLVETKADGSTLIELDGPFRFEGAPADIMRSTVHPHDSRIIYETMAGRAREVRIEQDVPAVARDLATHCDALTSEALLDVDSGALVYSCFERIATRTYWRDGVALPTCPENSRVLVVRGDVIVCRGGVLLGDAYTPFEETAFAARATSNAILTAQTHDGDAYLVALDSEARVLSSSLFVRPPAEHEGQRLFTLSIAEALSEDGTLYRLGRLGDAARGPQIVYALDANEARAVSSIYPPEAKLRLTTGP